MHKMRDCVGKICANMDEEPVFDLNLDAFESYIPDWGKERKCSDAELVAFAEVVEAAEAEKSGCFTTLSSNELHEIVTNAEARGTKRNTKWFMKMFEGKYQFILTAVIV